MRNVAAAYIDRLKEVYSVARDEELAERIKVAKSTLATWRTRGSIPTLSRISLERRSGVSYAEVERDYMGTLVKRSNLIEMALFLSVLKLGETLLPEQQSEWATWLTFNKAAVIDALFEGLDGIEDPNERTVQILMQVERGVRLSPEAFKSLRERLERKR